MSLSFGTPSSAPAAGGLAGGFSFGANKPATPGFGLTATSQPSTGLFGSTPATSAPAFGTPSFGSTSFGATTTPAFGAAAPTFGASTAAPAFGTTTPAFGAATSAPSFGTPATGGLTAPFGATTTTPAFGLGTGGLFGTGTSTSAPSTGISFGAPASTSAPSLGGLGGFSFAPATTQSTGFGLFNNTSTATTTTGLFGPKLGATTVTGTLPSTSVTPSLGLGGTSNLTSGVGTSNAKSDPPKQQKLPNEILTTVDSFKAFVKKQKSLSSEVMRVSVKPLHTVSRQAEETLRAAVSLQGAAARARGSARMLRQAAVAAAAAADAAARDHAYPGSELEGSAPPPFVKELISELEQKLIAFREHMDSADKQMQSSPKLLTEQELNLGFRRMHESLVGLAARLQAVHSQVEAQKEQYLNLRKYILKDPTDVFQQPSPTLSLDQILKDIDGSRKKKSGNTVDGSAVVADPRTALENINLAGPSPFGYSGGLSPFPLADNNAPSWQPQATPNTSATATGFNTTGLGSTGFGTTGFGTTGFGATGFGAAATDSTGGFQLQKPPGKRSKQ